MALGNSGNSILQVTGLENIKTPLTSLFINISADIPRLQLSAITNRRERVEAMVFQRAALDAAVEMGAVQRRRGTSAWWLNFEWGRLCRRGLARLY